MQNIYERFEITEEQRLQSLLSTPHEANDFLFPNDSRGH